mgnify:CR=1 FL=1
MKSIVKKSLCIICTLITLLCCTHVINADSSTTDITCDYTINNLGNGEAQITVCARTSIPVDKLSLTIYIEKYDPTSQTWQTVKVYTLTENDTNILCKTFTVKFTKEKYRIRGIACAQLNGITECISFDDILTWN